MGKKQLTFETKYEIILVLKVREGLLRASRRYPPYLPFNWEIPYENLPRYRFLPRHA